jgi:hypothetical protein
MGTIYRITPKIGRVAEGRVQGNGGVLRGHDGLRKLEFFARTGRFGGYQPLPGWVRVYEQFSAETNGPEFDVCIAGAKIEIVSETDCV